MALAFSPAEKLCDHVHGHRLGDLAVERRKPLTSRSVDGDGVRSRTVVVDVREQVNRFRFGILLSGGRILDTAHPTRVMT